MTGTDEIPGNLPGTDEIPGKCRLSQKVWRKAT
jgi:hypothetical protein